jgi:hypothetical protein
MGFGGFFEVTELIGWIIRSVAGWRYLLSGLYRREVHQRWRWQSRLTVAGEIFWGILAFLSTLFLAAVAIYLIVELSK